MYRLTLKSRCIMKTLENTTAFDKLSEQHKEFVALYLLTYSPKRVADKMRVHWRTTHEWLKREDVNNAIAEKRDEIQQRCDITVEECLNELSKIAFFDHKDYAKAFKKNPENGEFGVDLKEWDEMDTSAIQEMNIKIQDGVPIFTMKPYNKLEALKELINRLSGTNGDKHLHLHLKPEDLAKMDSKESSSNYQQLVQNAMTK